MSTLRRYGYGDLGLTLKALQRQALSPWIWRKIVGLSGSFLVLLFVLLAQPALAMEFEPEKCPDPDPEGKAYLSLGETVLRVPIRTLNIPHAPYADSPLPSPPDASQPLGCVGNPLAQQSLIIDFSFSAWLSDRKTPSAASLREFRLIRAEPDFYGLSQGSFYVSGCDLFPRRVRLGNGLQGCLPNKNPEHPDRDEVGRYRLDPQDYVMPFGQTFVMGCSPDIPRGVVCSVDYKVLPTVNLVYRFSTDRMPLEDVVEFDRMLRAQIEASVVPDYKWRLNEDQEGLQ
ncbi:hypothetical protein HW090_11665 [Pseudomonas sp. ABC1]|uniref:hypothetical protein n=1 Tax=Pseudomonas sp. ABC1 TaxID=2748080 RepID=UPI0015C2E504|nr:hypothetical protein [Pseudomonas sp. ABC1]QLF93819.1 hypothetical protein HW090_11665 [Pseudomonas sp. ABC1]